VPVSARLLKPGESVLLVADKRAFQLRYPYVPSSKIVGQFRGHLDSGGETVAVQTADGGLIKQFRYDDDSPWPTAAQGIGRTLVLKEPAKNPDAAEPSQWLLSAKVGGTPGESGTGSDTFSGEPAKDTDGDGLADLFEFASGSDPENPNSRLIPTATIAAFEVNGVRANYFVFSYNHRVTVQGVKFTVEWSKDLKIWSATDSSLMPVGTVTNRDGTITETYRGASPVLISATQPLFYRLKVQQL
jgi:hypothetical protein